MSKGYSDHFSGTGGSSQPYAPSYHVEPKMLQYDKNKGTFHNGKYDKNPTAQNLSDTINGNYIKGKNFNDNNMPYVIDLKGNIIIGKRNGNGSTGAATPHPTLIGGKDPQVQVAGILKIRGGKIYDYDHMSGHYKPNIKSMDIADETFGKLPKNLFSKKFVRSDKIWK